MGHRFSLLAAFGLSVLSERLSLSNSFSLISAAGLGQVSAENIDATTGLAINPALGEGVKLSGKFTSDALLKTSAFLGVGIPPAGMSMLNRLYLSSALGIGAPRQTELNIITNLQPAFSFGVGFLTSPKATIAAALEALPALGAGIPPTDFLLDNSLSIIPALGAGQTAISNFVADMALAAIIDLGMGASLSSGVTSETILNIIAPALGLGQSPVERILAATNLLALSALGAGLAEITGMSYGISVPMTSSIGMGFGSVPEAEINTVLSTPSLVGFGQSLDALMGNSLPLLAALGMSAVAQTGMDIVVNLTAAPSLGVGSALITGATIDAYLKALTALGIGASLQVGREIAAGFGITPVLGGGMLGTGCFASIVNLVALSALGFGASSCEASLISKLSVLPAIGAGQTTVNNISVIVSLAATVLQGLGAALPGQFSTDMSLVTAPAIGTAIAPDNLSLLSTLPLAAALGVSSPLQAGANIDAVFGVKSAQGLGVATPEDITISATLTMIPAFGIGLATISEASGAVSLFAAPVILGMGHPLLARASIVASMQGLPTQGTGLSQRVGANIISAFPGVSNLGSGLIVPSIAISAINLRAIPSQGAGVANIDSLLSATNLTLAPVFASGESPPAGLNTVALFQTPVTLAQGLALFAGLESGFKFGAISALMSGQMAKPKIDIDAVFEPPSAVMLGVTPSGLTVVLPYFATFVRDLRDPIIVRLLKDPIIVRILR
jgi:hypothetical protein